MKRFSLRNLLFLTLCCDLGLFSKRLIAPAANILTDFLRIPGGIGTSFSLMFLVVAAELVPIFGCATLMSIIQSMIALSLGMVGSMGAHRLHRTRHSDRSDLSAVAENRTRHRPHADNRQYARCGVCQSGCEPDRVPSARRSARSLHRCGTRKRRGVRLLCRRPGQKTAPRFFSFEQHRVRRTEYFSGKTRAEKLKRLIRVFNGSPYDP